MKIVNLTMHDIVFVKEDGSKITVNPSGIVARVSVKTETIGSINGIPVTESIYGTVQNLPDYEEGTIYIVSSMVAQRCPNRKDVFIPNESIRDQNGNIIGCKSLGII